MSALAVALTELMFDVTTIGNTGGSADSVLKVPGIEAGLLAL